MNIQNISAEHHNRQVTGKVYLPDKTPCPIVIFSHGFNGSGDDFKDSAQFLAKNGIGSYTYDFCGGSLHSESPLATTDMTIFTEKEDLLSVLDTVIDLSWVDNNNIFLFGASMGGFVTALTAEEKEELIRGMVLLYPALCIADDWNSRFEKKEDIPDVYNLWEVPLGRHFFETLRGFHIFDNIGKFQKNVLIMHGGLDNVVSLEYSRKAHTLYPHSRLEIFPGEGHGFSARGNQDMTTMLLDFVRENQTFL